MDSKQLIAFIPLSVGLALGIIGAILDKKRKKEFEFEMDRERDTGFILETSKYKIYRKGIINFIVLCSAIIVTLIIIFFAVKNTTVKTLFHGTVLITFFLLITLRTIPTFIFKYSYLQYFIKLKY